MENFESQQLTSQLVELCKESGLQLTEDQCGLMVRHLDLVIEKNKVMNLTRILEPSEALVLHCLDSLLPLLFIGPEIGSQSAVFDLGTGAGFPGIPLGIVTGAKCTLLDSVGKKIAAVNEFAQDLGLNRVKGVHARVEEFALKNCEKYDFVFARAVAQSNVLVEYASPLLKLGGKLVLEKANPSVQEINAASRAAKICGMHFVSRETFDLPNNLGHREILIYKKTRKPSIQLPRKNGQAKNDPLGLKE